MVLIRKKEGAPKGPLKLDRSFLRLEAISSVNRSIAFRFERNLIGFTTIATSNVVHLARAVHSSLTLGTIVWTTSWFISEPFFGIKCLLLGRKCKLFATIAANKSFVLIIQENSPPPW
jgi:hypothetical protein